LDLRVLDTRGDIKSKDTQFQKAVKIKKWKQEKGSYFGLKRGKKLKKGAAEGGASFKPEVCFTNGSEEQGRCESRRKWQIKAPSSFI